jgi:hypothetical protein
MVAVRGVEVTGSSRGCKSHNEISVRFGKVGWGTQGVLVGHEAFDGWAGISVQNGDEGKQHTSFARNLKRAVSTTSLLFFLNRNIAGRFM